MDENNVLMLSGIVLIAVSVLLFAQPTLISNLSGQPSGNISLQKEVDGNGVSVYADTQGSVLGAFSVSLVSDESIDLSYVSSDSYSIVSNDDSFSIMLSGISDETPSGKRVELFEAGLNKSADVSLVVNTLSDISGKRLSVSEGGYSASAFNNPSPCPPLGDVNEDGVVDIIDGLLVDKYIKDYDLGDTTFIKANADVTGDGNIDISDSDMIAKYDGDLISDFPGCGDGETPENPTASFTVSDTNPKVGKEVFFDGTDSSGGGSSIVSYNWDFGDGNTGLGETSRHTYTSSGTYAVTLKVKNEDGGTDIMNYNLSTVSSEDPTALFNWSPESPRFGETVTLDASESSPGGSNVSIVSYEWDIGGVSKSGKTVDYSWDTSGSKKVKLTIANSQSIHDSITTYVSVSSGQPVPRFSYSPSDPAVGEEVSFDATTSQPIAQGIEITSYDWTFGQVGDASGEDASFSFNDTGYYPVTLEITTSAGTSEKTTDTVHVVGEGRDEISPMILAVTSMLGGILFIFGANRRW